MNRQKIILGDYTYIVELYKAGIDLKNPTYNTFYILKDIDIVSNVTSNKNVYFINKDTYDNNKIIYPLNETTSVGYSFNIFDFNSNISSDTLDENIYHLYKKNNDTFVESQILCDMIRIYFPIIKNNLDSLIDVENMINDTKFHYLIDDINNYARHSKTELKFDNQLYSEYIDIYVPSLNTLLYDNSLYIDDYDIWINDADYRPDINVIEESINEDSHIPFNILYYPYKISQFKLNDETVLHYKSYVKNSTYINTQFYSTLNVILYPYEDVDNSNKFILNNDLNINETTFTNNLEITLSTDIRFPVENDFNNINDFNKYYGVPCAVSKFNISNFIGNTLIEKYLTLNGLTLEDYEEYTNDGTFERDIDDEYFGEDYIDITKTGFRIEMSTDKMFSNIFFKYNVIIKDVEPLIDDFIFPLSDIFNTWNDIPNLILYRITFIDKVACFKVSSNPVIIINEWYKYLTDKELKHKLHFNKVYKKVNDNMIVGNYNDSENPILFIDKINCSIIKDNEENEQGMNITKKNSPKVIYKPVFYKVSELQTINIKAGVSQNIGINLGDYMSKVETFKLLIGDEEYIEYGRNTIFVIFNINATKLTETSGKYIITNEDDEYISDGEYYIN